MARLMSTLCALVGATFALLALLILVTKLSSPDVRGLLFVAAFGLAAFVCLRAAAKLWRRDTAVVDNEADPLS